MANADPPAGWDDDLRPEVIEGARELRKTYVAMLAVGFSTHEASSIIAHYLILGQSQGDPSD